MPAYDFPGGIYPPDRKSRTNQSPLSTCPLPNQVRLLLKQHAGNPAIPCVVEGDTVAVGQQIAKREGTISANVHASISGTVSHVDDDAIVLKSDGLDTWRLLPRLDWREVTPDVLLERLEECGLVGLGGAGFPAHIKAHVASHHTIDTLIVNAAECEPYITADDLTLRSYPCDVLEGAQLIAKVCGARQIVVGIEDNKPEAIKALKKALTESQRPVTTALKIIETRYPSGGERQLIKKLLNRAVPSHGLPVDVGVLCHNPGTLLAALYSVREGKPLVERVVTLTGDAINNPGNVWVRLGMSVSELLMHAGLIHQRLYHVILGGPMMGRPLSTLETPVLKTTNCLIAATKEELPPLPMESPCIRCGACESVCPEQLLPQQLHWYAHAEADETLQKLNLFDCIECGACSFVCPSYIPLVDEYRVAKQRIRLKRIESAKADHAKYRFEFRQARLEREEAEKQARRKARQVHSRQNTNSLQAGQNTPSADDLRSLRIAQTAAKAAVKKAEKVLARAAEQAPNQRHDDLELQLATAHENLKAADARLSKARSNVAQKGEAP